MAKAIEIMIITTILTSGIVMAVTTEPPVVNATTPRSSFQVALDQFKDDMINTEIAEFVVDCYYRVGRLKWQLFTSHPCNRLDSALAKMGKLGNATPKIEKSLALAYQVVSVDQQVDAAPLACV